jgi:hypothetical protein
MLQVLAHVAGPEILLRVQMYKRRIVEDILRYVLQHPAIAGPIRRAHPAFRPCRTVSRSDRPAEYCRYQGDIESPIVGHRVKEPHSSMGGQLMTLLLGGQLMTCCRAVSPIEF